MLVFSHLTGCDTVVWLSTKNGATTVDLDHKPIYW